MRYIHQFGRQLFVGGNDHSILGTNPQGGSTIGDGIQGVLNLEQLSSSGKGGQGKAISRVSHGCKSIVKIKVMILI
jgi:hypothetical protein